MKGGSVCGIMNYEDALRKIGPFGRYQRLVFCLGSLLTFGMAITAYGYVFITAFVDHWCYIPEITGLNLTLEQKKDLSLPTTEINGVIRHR